MSLAALRSRLVDQLEPVAGWSPDDPARRSDYDLNPGYPRSGQTLRAAAVLIPVIAHEAGPTVLLTRRADTLTSHPGQIAFPGGRLDPGETAVEAALREAWEEVALAPAAVEVLGLSEAYETGTGFLITPVIGWLARPPSLLAQADEVADIFEVPWDFLMDLGNHRRDHLDIKDGGRRWFWAMPWQERYIWGVTASIIRSLRARLYGETPDSPAVIAGDAA